ncbi:MAG TPA: C-terminal helicase domain-containing protein, partial [Bacillota bacterium]|nr:C-terminal helicase domain-containing protein [Bacillota bacterium]
SQAFDLSPEQRPIISTVDDFQGDERDIVIVSMVRNPRDPSRSKAEFIKAFERINVAFSRARRLLIILGCREYLTLYGKIDLPDMNGDPLRDRQDYPIFQHIINTIQEKGKVLCDTDFLKTEEPANGKR